MVRLPPFARSYVALLATMVIARIAVSALGAGAMIESQNLALSPITLVVLALLGAAGLVVAGRIGLTERWGDDGARRWLAVAIACGLVNGLLSMSSDLASWAAASGSESHRAVWGTVDIHQRFPGSVPFYWYGGCFLEIFLRLFGLSVLTWLLRPILDRRRGGHTVAFWTANVLVSLYEPWPYLMTSLAGAPAAAWPSLVVARVLDMLFVVNFFTGILFRRSGIWAAVLFRFSMYLVWHIAYGGFRSYWIDLLVR